MTFCFSFRRLKFYPWSYFQSNQYLQFFFKDNFSNDNLQSYVSIDDGPQFKAKKTFDIYGENFHFYTNYNQYDDETDSLKFRFKVTYTVIQLTTNDHSVEVSAESFEKPTVNATESIADNSDEFVMVEGSDEDHEDQAPTVAACDVSVYEDPNSCNEEDDKDDQVDEHDEDQDDDQDEDQDDDQVEDDEDQDEEYVENNDESMLEPPNPDEQTSAQRETGVSTVLEKSSENPNDVETEEIPPTTSANDKENAKEATSATTEFDKSMSKLTLEERKKSLEINRKLVKVIERLFPDRAYENLDNINWISLRNTPKERRDSRGLMLAKQTNLDNFFDLLYSGDVWRCDIQKETVIKEFLVKQEYSALIRSQAWIDLRENTELYKEVVEKMMESLMASP